MWIAKVRKEKAARDGYCHDRHGDAVIGGAAALGYSASFVLAEQE